MSTISRIQIALIGMLLGGAIAFAWAVAEAQQVAAVKAVRPTAHDLTAASQTVAAEQLRASIVRAVEERLGTLASDVQVHLLDEPDAISVPGGRLEIRPKTVADDVIGRRVYQLSIIVDGTVARSVSVKAETLAWADVVTAARNLRRDDVLEADDITLERVALASGKQELVRSMEDVIGKRLTKPVSVHKPLPISALTEPYAVRRGDRVTIEAKRGGLLIQTAGLTKGAAQAGDSVTVTNLDSGKDVRARVIGPGSVRVEF
ncbi:MAG TPA: flagellar basal body P-ring formation chaperone FlgA [Nitrospirales bacterium]|nr:flagellar basal body P-ring formation chaperone FlgA [Nitrospirales bacterium]